MCRSSARSRPRDSTRLRISTSDPGRPASTRTSSVAPASSVGPPTSSSRWWTLSVTLLIAASCQMERSARLVVDGRRRFLELGQTVRLQKGLRDCLRGLLVDADGPVHGAHRRQRQLRADRVDSPPELRPELSRELLAHDRSHILEAEDVLRVLEHGVGLALELRVGREHVSSLHLALVEHLVGAHAREWPELTVLRAVYLPRN